jgi:probable rRNA maturation factor
LVIMHKPVKGASQRALERFARQAQRAAGVRGEVSVLVASSRAVRGLNRRFCGVDKPTDVLSFPPLPGLDGPFAGDIVICGDVAARNARRFRHSTADELKVLILHGMLHLAGYDHEHDRGEMARREERLRKQLGLQDGLIRRTAARGRR